MKCPLYGNLINNYQVKKYAQSHVFLGNISAIFYYFKTREGQRRTLAEGRRGVVEGSR